MIPLLVYHKRTSSNYLTSSLINFSFSFGSFPTTCKHVELPPSYKTELPWIPLSPMAPTLLYSKSLSMGLLDLVPPISQAFVLKIASHPQLLLSRSSAISLLPNPMANSQPSPYSTYWQHFTQWTTSSCFKYFRHLASKTPSLVLTGCSFSSPSLFFLIFTHSDCSSSDLQSHSFKF